MSTVPARLPGAGQAASCAQTLWRLLAHNWSKMTYVGPLSKPDQVEVTHGRDLGDELTTSLSIDTERGTPLAPNQLTRRDNSPWDNAERRPSHADRRKTLQAACLAAELSTDPIRSKLPQKKSATSFNACCGLPCQSQ